MDEITKARIIALSQADSFCEQMMKFRHAIPAWYLESLDSLDAALRAVRELEAERHERVKAGRI